MRWQYMTINDKFLWKTHLVQRRTHFISTQPTSRKKNMANIRTAHNWNHKYFSPKKSSNTQKLSTHSQVSDTHTHTRRRHTESNVQFRFGLLAIYKYRWPGEMANQSFIKCVESWLSFHHIYIYRWYIVQVEQLSESRVVCVWQFLVFPKFKSK